MCLHSPQKEAGISAAHYHAGVSDGKRVQVQNAWRSGEVQVRARIPASLPVSVSFCVAFSSCSSQRVRIGATHTRARTSADT